MSLFLISFLSLPNSSYIVSSFPSLSPSFRFVFDPIYFRLLFLCFLSLSYFSFLHSVFQVSLSSLPSSTNIQTLLLLPHPNFNFLLPSSIPGLSLSYLILLHSTLTQSLQSSSAVFHNFQQPVQSFRFPYLFLFYLLAFQMSRVTVFLKLFIFQ